MSEPLWIDCASVADIGSAEEIGALATPARHVVLRFAAISGDEKSVLIRRLSDALPEHSVFYSGGSEGRSWITVMKVVDSSRVLPLRSEILRAVEEYRRICASLVAQYLADTLPRDWETGEHGGHCRFRNRHTGQVVEAPMREWVNPDCVDPYFFAMFVRSTPGCEPVAALLTNDYHDPARALDVVEYGPNEFHDPKNIAGPEWREPRRGVHPVLAVALLLLPCLAVPMLLSVFVSSWLGLAGALGALLAWIWYGLPAFPGFLQGMLSLWGFSICIGAILGHVRIVLFGFPE